MADILTLGAPIKTAYEGQPDTNAYTNAEKSKLAGIETGAEVNVVTSVNSKTGAVVLTKGDFGLGNVDNTSDVNKPVSTAQQAAINSAAANVFALGGPIMVLATGGSTATSLADRFTVKGTYFNAVTDFGIDNTGATDVRDQMQAFLALAGKSYHVTLEIPSGTYKIGSNLTTNLQDILHYYSNCSIIIRGILQHNVNSGNQHIIAGQNVSTDGGSRNDHVYLWWFGGKVQFMPRTISQSRKGPNFSFTDFCSSVGYECIGDDSGSFEFQGRDCTMFYIAGTLMDAGDSVGEDGFHLTRNCQYGTIYGLNIESGDDAISFTQENGGGPYDMHDITVSNCNVSSTQNSSFKILVDAASGILGSRIHRINWTGGTWGVARKQPFIGTLCRITTDSQYPESVADVNITGVTGNSDGGAIASTSIRVDYASRIHFNDMDISGTLRNAIIYNGSIDCTINGGSIGQPTSQLNGVNLGIDLVIDTLTWTSGSTVVAHCSNNPDLSSFVTNGVTFTGITIPPGTSAPVNASNIGTWQPTAIDNTAKTITYTVQLTRQSATDNETGLSAPAYIRKQAGECIQAAGAQNLTIDGLTLYGSIVGTDGKLQCHTQAVNLKTDSSSSCNSISSNTVGLGFKTFRTAVNATSTTSNTVGTGTFSFVTQSGKGYTAGQVMNIVSTGTPANSMTGTVVSYTTVSNVTTLVFTATSFTGTGTNTDWSIYGEKSGFALSPGAIVTLNSTGTAANVMKAKVIGYTGVVLNVQVLSFTGSGTNIDWSINVGVENPRMNIHFNRFPMEVAYNLQQCANGVFRGDAINCNGRMFYQEGTSVMNGNNRFIDILDEGYSRYRVTAQVAKSNSLSKGTRGFNNDTMRFDVSIPVGQTSATIVFANSYTLPTGTNTSNWSNPWTRAFAFNLGAMKPGHMRLIPTSLEFQDWFITNNGSGTYTITLKTAPVSNPATASGILSTEYEW